MSWPTFRSSSTPGDEVGFKRIVNKPSRGVGDTIRGYSWWPRRAEYEASTSSRPRKPRRGALRGRAKTGLKDFCRLGQGIPGPS